MFVHLNLEFLAQFAFPNRRKIAWFIKNNGLSEIDLFDELSSLHKFIDLNANTRQMFSLYNKLYHDTWKQRQTNLLRTTNKFHLRETDPVHPVFGKYVDI